jgi:hypothetical protein
MSEDAHFHHWELGFKQSGLRHITRALRGSAINTFTKLHAFPPCCCPLALSRPGEVGDPEASSFRTSTLCESDPTPSETAQLPDVTGSPGLAVLRRLRPVPTRSADDGPNPRQTPLAAGIRARIGTVPMFAVARSTKEEPCCCPCGIRHGQPAALHRGLLAVVDKTTREFPWRRQPHQRRVRTAPGPHPPDSGPVET